MSAWLGICERVLRSEAGERLRAAAKIAVDTVLRVARHDAAHADRLTGRGVSTSHETVAKDLGMSKRHVGTARRLLEKLGLAVTVVRGRELSPAERAAAREAHGSYQTSAASVRALIMPAPASLPVDDFHLPRRGSVLEESPVPKNSPKRAQARSTAAARPRSTKRRDSRPDRAPRALELQRFAWQIAKHFGLLAPELSRTTRDPRTLASWRSSGSLAGGRHIGQLCRILERHEITPARYTLDTLRVELDAALRELNITPLAGDAKRDRIAHFAWTLAQLARVRGAATLLELRRAEEAQRQLARREAQRQAAELARKRERMLEESRAAAAAALASIRRSPAPTTRLTARDHEQIITAALGPGILLHTASEQAQLLVGHLTDLHRALRGAGGWELHTEGSVLTWSTPDDQISASVTGQHVQLTGPTSTPLPDDAQNAVHALQTCAPLP